MFHYLHGYHPDIWKGYEKRCVLRKEDGIRFVQCATTPENYRFNEVTNINRG